MSSAAPYVLISSPHNFNMAQQGFGAMGLSAFYGSASTTSEDDKIAVVLRANQAGVKIINSAVFYGPLNVDGYGANLRLLNKVIHHPDYDATKTKVMVKIGMDTRAPAEKTGTMWKVMSSEEDIRADVDYALEQLGVSCLDIAVLCRVPLDEPIETPIAAMAKLVAEGKIKAIGVSEASSENIRRAHAVHPISFIEAEWSLWARDIEPSIVPTCRELGISIVAYSPLGRGFLTGTLRSRSSEEFGAHDFRLMAFPRMAEGQFETNLALVDGLKPIVAGKGCTEGQLALTWLQHQGVKHGVTVIPIPGTSKLEHLEKNLAARDMTLTPEEEAEIESIFNKDIDSVVGGRYAAHSMRMCHNSQGDAAAAGEH